MRGLWTVGLLVTMSLAGAPEPLVWPEGAGRKLVQQNCLICHNGEIIASQRLNRQLWDKTVTKMMGWGAPVPKDEKAALLDYLSHHFSEKTPPPRVRRFRLEP